MAEQGCLLWFGPRVTTLYEHSHVARIFKELILPTFPSAAQDVEIAINLKTAKTLGMTLPLTLQAQADEVINETLAASRPRRWPPPKDSQSAWSCECRGLCPCRRGDRMKRGSSLRL